MKVFQVTIIGNSVALRTRPHRPDSKNYGQLLGDMLNEQYPDRITMVRNLSVGRATLTDVKKMEADVINQFPDVYILNLGVCDASTREVPFWYAEIMNSKKTSLLRTLALSLHHHLFKRFRPRFVQWRGKKPWISARRFKKLYQELLYAIQHNTNAGIIALSINQANERVESQIPGSADNYRRYSQIIQEVAAEFSIPFLNLNDLDSESHYPDGVHFSDAGHEIVARRLLDCLETHNYLSSQDTGD